MPTFISVSEFDNNTFEHDLELIGEIDYDEDFDVEDPSDYEKALPNELTVTFIGPNGTTAFVKYAVTDVELYPSEVSDIDAC
jgi:hypothetical protein